MNKKLSFPTHYSSIIDILNQYSPDRYGASRNYIDGDVSYLSPYISRGVISTKFVVSHLVQKGYNLRKIEKFVQELAWRDYWQQIWIHKEVDHDLRHVQPNVAHHKIPSAVINATTGISFLDHEIKQLEDVGYVHNHSRMYLSMLICNIGQSHWKKPAQWMYYHLLDHDWASNALSWQWVSGANSHKKYIANQANINKYTHTDQKYTFLDTSYEEIEKLSIPESLKECSDIEFKTQLPSAALISIDKEIPTFIYNSYNLDPLWNNDIEGNRILLLEPSHFDKYPISSKVLDFILALSKNIDGIQLYVGEFTVLEKELQSSPIYYKEHPTVHHYKGTEESRDWISNVKGYYPSFFKFWKLVKKEIFKSYSHAV